MTDQPNDTETVQEAAARPLATIGDFVRLNGNLWLAPHAVLGAQIVRTETVDTFGFRATENPFTVQMLIAEVGWITVAYGGEAGCTLILREALLIIYNERR
jgi:hypothetical protein